MFWEIEEIKEIKQTKPIVNKPPMNSSDWSKLTLNRNSYEFLGHVLFKFIFSTCDYDYTKNTITHDEEKITFKNYLEKIELYKTKNSNFDSMPFNKVKIHSDYYDVTYFYDWERLLLFANMFELNPQSLSTIINCSLNVNVIGFEKGIYGIYFDLKSDSKVSNKLVFYYDELDFIPYVKSEYLKKLKGFLCSGK